MPDFWTRCIVSFSLQSPRSTSQTAVVLCAPFVIGGSSIMLRKFPVRFVRTQRPSRKRMSTVRIGCELLEDRTAPALFTALAPVEATGLFNNGCVVVGDLNKDGK